jgi:putative spermidine/putrescine transport system ATP-binding protein
MARLELHNLSKRYGDHAAVAGVTLDVPDGEFLVLLGPSGCGKTTTLRMIAGFVEPSGGTATIGGTDVTHLPPWRRNTGMVFQSYALFPHMTVAENVAFGLEMRKLARPEIAARAKEVLRLVRLEGYAERLPRELSGGQQQRVALARALAVRPDVLLLDEPLSNLDAKLREEVRIEIRELQRQLGLTTIMVDARSGRKALTGGGPPCGDGGRENPPDRQPARPVRAAGPTASSPGFLSGAAPSRRSITAPGRSRPRRAHSMPRWAACGALLLRPERLSLGAKRDGQSPAGQGGIRLISGRRAVELHVRLSPRPLWWCNCRTAGAPPGVAAT